MSPDADYIGLHFVLAGVGILISLLGLFLTISNWYAIILFGQVLATQFGGDIFRTVPLTVCEWLTIAAVTCPVLVIGEIVRFIGRMRARA